MGYPGKVKFPNISYHFAKRDHKGEISTVFSAIYYLKYIYIVCNSGSCTLSVHVSYDLHSQ